MSLEDQLSPFLESYNALPRWLRLTLGTAYRHLPHGWRYGARYGEFKDLAVAGEQWSVEEIQDYQLKQLRAVLHHAANHCPFYEKRFLRAGFRPENVHAPEDLKECPFLEKRDLQEHLNEMVSTNIPASRRPSLNAYPSAALQLAEYVEKFGEPWRLPLRGLLCGSERLTIPQKQLLERVFQCRAYRWYGHSERAVLAGEGARSELFYFFPQYGFVEFGPPDEEGLREVIGTSFHNLAMPLIRYRTGDCVRLAEPEDVSSLEYPWPAAVEIAGRQQEYLVSATGRRISLTAFNMHNAVFNDLYAVQFYQERPGLAEFRYVAGPRFHGSRLTAIEESIRRKLGDGFQISFREVKEVEKTARGKHRWLVSQLPEAGMVSG